MEVAELSRLTSCRSAIVGATSGNTSVGLAVAAGRICRCLIVMPENMTRESVELVRGYRAGVVAWSSEVRPSIQSASTDPPSSGQMGGRIAHFTAGAGNNGIVTALSRHIQGQQPRLHVLGDDPQRSVYPPGRSRQLSLLEDFWPATFDLYQAQRAGSVEGDSIAVPPAVPRAVWAALDVGSEVGPHDVVVVLIPGSADPLPSQPDDDFWGPDFSLDAGAGDLARAGSGASHAVPAPVHVRPQEAAPVAVLEPLVRQAEDQAIPVAGLARDRQFLGRRSRRALRYLVGSALALTALLLGILTGLAVSPSLLGVSRHRVAHQSTATAGSSTRGASVGAAPGPTLTGFPAYAARVRAPSISVYQDPTTTSRRIASFPAVGDYRAAQTFLVEGEQREPDGVWYRVLLPVRPNGTTGWVRSSDVEVLGLPYRIKVHLDSLRLELFHDGRLERTFPIAIGTVDTPTPPGTYAIKYLLRPDDQNTLYGHFVFGLSGYSDSVRKVLGDGELGIHGTNDPESSIGRRVSHGCIRLRNEDIESLVPLLPLGTPVDVVDHSAPGGTAVETGAATPG